MTKTTFQKIKLDDQIVATAEPSDTNSLKLPTSFNTERWRFRKKDDRWIRRALLARPCCCERGPTHKQATFSPSDRDISTNEAGFSSFRCCTVHINAVQT